MLWHSLGSWSDRGSRQTESFDVTTGALRVAWETFDESAANIQKMCTNYQHNVTMHVQSKMMD